MNIAGYIDHTILKPTTTLSEIKKVCGEATRHGFKAVCIPPPFVKNAKTILSDTTVSVATVIGFPFGYNTAKAKLAEVQQAIDDGADELDVVINLVALKSGAWNYLETEMHQLVEAAHNRGKLIKVIIESGILTDEEILQCCRIYSKLQVDFLKTSTGYAEKGASVHAVSLMRANLPESIRIKASGGIRDYEFARQLIAAGAERLGCSASVAIAEGESSENGQKGSY
ncbi:MAG TPA: deoxyribose-phosphate aldolase [Emticicia sp.]